MAILRLDGVSPHRVGGGWGAEYVAPDGAGESFWVRGFYNDSAPTALGHGVFLKC